MSLVVGRRPDDVQLDARGVSWAITGSAGHDPAAERDLARRPSTSATSASKLGGVVDLVLEVGEVTGSQLQTFNTFDPASHGVAHSFASFAITFGK